MSGITLSPNDRLLARIDSLAEASVGAEPTPGVLNEAELAALPPEVRAIAANPQRSSEEDAFLTQVRDALTPRSAAGAGLSQPLAMARGLTARPGFFSRTWEGLKDAFLSLVGRGDSIDSWWFNEDAIRAGDQSAIASLIQEMDPSQRAAIQSPEFPARLAEAMDRDPDYRALNRNSADDDAAMIQQVLLSHLRGLAEREAAPAIAVEELPPLERSEPVESVRGPGGTTHALAELPESIANDPFFANSSENFRLWFRGGWGTIDDRERRVLLERAAGLPEGLRSVDGGAELNTQNFETLYAHTRAALQAKGFDTLQEALQEAQRQLGVEPDGKPGGATFDAFRAWVSENQGEDAQWWQYTFLDVLE